MSKFIYRKNYIMEFNEKLQQLRKNRGLTQEELAEAIYVSRTAISKWESGRGYPNIESLKALSKFFAVSIDELLTGEKILDIAVEENKFKISRIKSLVFAILDISGLLFLFLPLFGEKSDNAFVAVSLLNTVYIESYLLFIYISLVILSALCGAICLIIKKDVNYPSLIISAMLLFVFIASSQPYAGALMFIFITIKVLMLTRKQ